ncbi:hypothetical protein [Streptomyces sp. BPTC-684]|uniref:hypothetical protein n=1 Tax=Streptomyces sp. BPTC-684 TaxID=3043734 RepID=UPI0024B1BD21|nr:hypothetical protein [Streptomyces sp. BPTC-684]WHM37088.1 hypothetical protein QIY60_09385 [Streptomyces sp. BPTC-684]
MLTYELIMKTDLSQLTTAATKWDDMAGELKKLEERYRTQVQNVSLDGTWTGQASLYSRPNFAATHTQYVAAQTEAKAVASLLRDAHAQFVDLKKRVESARDDAVKAGMKVSETGAATFDYSKVSAAEANTVRHDPDLRTTESSWSQHIAQAVSAMNDADQGVKIALEAVGADSDLFDDTRNGFNAKASGDVEHYEAQAMIQLADKVNDGKKLSPEELAEAESLFRDNSHDKVFTQTLLQGLGPDGAIKFTQHVNDWSLSDKSHKDDYAALERGFATSLATATTVPGKVTDMPPGSAKYNEWLNSPDGKFYKGWMEGVEKAGAHNYGDNLRPLSGYHVLASLMGHADATYDDQFLYALGDKMIDAEKKDHNLFKVWGADYKGIEPDPIDTLLGVMGKNPDAATAFFDPSGNGAGTDHVGNDHLKYLAGHGDGTRQWPNHSYSGGVGVATYDNPTSRAGLGAALEAATTGHPPLHEGERGGEPGPHTPAQARVMQNMLTTLDAGLSGEKLDPDMQKNIGHALADYVQDTHHILAESGSKYGSPDGLDHIWSQGDDAGITVSKGTLMRVMRGASSDSQTFSLLYDTQQQYAIDQLSNAPHAGGEGYERWKNPASEMGSVMGAMNSIGSDVIFDERSGKIQAANDMAKYAYHFAGAPVTGLPVLGDTAQRLIDAGTYEWSKDVIATAQSKAQEMNSHQYSSGVTGTYNYIDQWATAHGVDINDETNSKGNPNWDAWQSMRREAKQSYTSSRGDAAAYLGWE